VGGRPRERIQGVAEFRGATLGSGAVHEGGDADPRVPAQPTVHGSEKIAMGHYLDGRAPDREALGNHSGSGRSTISGRAGRTNAPAGTSLKTTAFGPMDAWSPTVMGPTTTALGAR
jgi:hypothetical protein